MRSITHPCWDLWIHYNNGNMYSLPYICASLELPTVQCRTEMRQMADMSGPMALERYTRSIHHTQALAALMLWSVSNS